MELPKYLQIVNHIRAAVTSGAYRQGDRLPTHEELAAEWDAYPSLVTKSIRVLKAEGVVYTTHAGTFIGPHPDSKEQGDP